MVCILWHDYLDLTSVYTYQFSNLSHFCFCLAKFSDCICSAFDFSGKRQCPNCADIEEGYWNFTNRRGMRQNSHTSQPANRMAEARRRVGHCNPCYSYVVEARSVPYVNPLICVGPYQYLLAGVDLLVHALSSIHNFKFFSSGD